MKFPMYTITNHNDELRASGSINKMIKISETCNTSVLCLNLSAPLFDVVLKQRV